MITKLKDRERLRINVFMAFAKSIASLSTCSRLRVGTVITDSRMERVLGIGYNGNAMGEPNRCDSDEPGRCGCIHSEVNALIKSGSENREKVMFVTTRPCRSCSKLIINSGFIRIFYQDEYRLDDGALYLLGKHSISWMQWKLED